MNSKDFGPSSMWPGLMRRSKFAGEVMWAKDGWAEVETKNRF